MIEKIKYHLRSLKNCRKMRVGCIAVVTAFAIAAATLLSCSIHTVEIFDGETTYTVRTLNRNTANIMESLNLKSSKYSVLSTDVSKSTTSIEIAYTFPVYITCGDKTEEITFSEGTVKDALEKAGYEIDEYDMVEPALDTVIEDTVYIDYIDIAYVKGSYNESIPYSTKTVYSSKTEKGVTTLSEGKEGVKQVNYTEKLVNGEVTEKKITGTKVIEKPLNAVKTIGTKTNKKTTAVKSSSSVKTVSVLKPSFEIKLDKNGNPVNYKSKRIARATAYTYTGNNCSTGVAPKPGYIAVNPKVIPYGTKMYIKTPNGSYVYGYAVAADTGGFIKKHPTGVDLFLTSESACVAFGVRNVEIYILE